MKSFSYSISARKNIIWRWTRKRRSAFYHCQFLNGTVPLFCTREDTASRYLTSPIRLQHKEKTSELSPNCSIRAVSKNSSSSVCESLDWDSYVLCSCIGIFLGQREAIRKFCQTTNSKGSVLISFHEQRGKLYLNVGNFQFYKCMQIKHGDKFCSFKILN